MWSWFQTPKKELDKERTYLRIQFLTPQQKSIKKDIFKKLEKQYKNDQESIIPYQGSFPVSFTFTLNTHEISGVAQPIRQKIILSELACHLQVTKNQQLQSFMKGQVKEIQMFLLNQNMISKNDVIALYNQMEVSMYDPSQVLQIIYQPKSIWEKVKIKAKNAVSNIPKLFLSIFTKILKVLLAFMGFNSSATSLIWKMLPTKQLIQWIITFVSMFFPMLGPLINMGSRMIM